VVHVRISIARLVSDATRLPLLAVPLFLLIGAAAGWRGILWALLCLLLTSGLSLAYLAYLARFGRVGDPRKISQKERIRPLWVVGGLHAGAWLLITLLGAPAPFGAILLSYALATAAFALLTPLLKLSLHTGGVSGTLVCLAYVFGGWVMLFAPMLPAVWWARRALGRHSHPELGIGALVGAGLTWLAFQLVI
jgi:hypothetical protein